MEKGHKFSNLKFEMIFFYLEFNEMNEMSRSAQKSNVFSRNGVCVELYTASSENGVVWRLYATPSEMRVAQGLHATPL